MDAFSTIVFETKKHYISSIDEQKNVLLGNIILQKKSLYILDLIGMPVVITVILLLSSFVSAQETALYTPKKKETKIEIQDTSKSNNIILNVDIFGEGAIGSYYVLWSEMDLSDEMKKLLTTRDFARDEFFMQNIDREQFEQERMLQLFEDKKREYFAIFPEEALKALEDEERDK